MKKLTRIFAVLLSLALLFSLTACGGGGKTGNSDNSDALSAENVAGTYTNAGGSRVNSVDWDEFYNSVSMGVKVTASGQNTLLISLGSLGVYSDLAEMTYDPTTGTAKGEDDNATYTVTFARSGDGYTVHLTEHLDETLFMDFYGEK